MGELLIRGDFVNRGKELQVTRGFYLAICRGVVEKWG